VAGTADRKSVLLRLDPAVHDALARWAGDELRSTNAQIEFLLRSALTKAGRMPREAKKIPRRGRPARQETTDDGVDGADPAPSTEDTGDTADTGDTGDTGAAESADAVAAQESTEAQ
jgi:hypothetical protein